MRSILASAALIACAAAPVQAQFVSPASRAAYEGSSSTTYPLGRHNARIQTLHDDVPASLTTIVGHAYRRDAISTRGQIQAFQVDMEVQLSIAQTTASTASSNFGNNAGAAPTTVLPRTMVSFPTTDRPAVDPAPPEFFVIYATPFVRPGGSGTLCLDTTIYGNVTANGNDVNFSASLDAHAQTTDGSVFQPGYRYGTGCLAPNQSTAHYALMDLHRTPTDLEFSIHSRYGVKTTDPANPAEVVMMLGVPTSAPWPTLPTCTNWTTPNVVLALGGPTDATGHWTASYTGLGALPPGARFYVQLASGNAATGELSFSDGVALTVPMLDPLPRAACRIAAGSDRTRPTGTVSYNVPVTEFF